MVLSKEKINQLLGVMDYSLYRSHSRTHSHSRSVSSVYVILGDFHGNNPEGKNAFFQ